MMVIFWRQWAEMSRFLSITPTMVSCLEESLLKVRFDGVHAAFKVGNLFEFQDFV